MARKGNGTGKYYLFAETALILNLPRSYYKGIELGYLTEDPAALHNPNVCAEYIKTPE